MTDKEKAGGFPPYVLSVSRLPNGELHMNFDEDALFKEFGIDYIPPTEAEMNFYRDLLAGTLVAYPYEED